MSATTPTNCGACGIPVVVRRPSTVPPLGSRFHMGRGLCTACYLSRRKAGTLTDSPPVRFGTRADDLRTYVPARDRTGSFGRFQLRPTHLMTAVPSGFAEVHEVSVTALHVDLATAHAAALQVCSHATDVDDARRLLAMLGLGGAS